MVKEATIDIRPPITSNGKLDFDGVLSFSLHNAGTATVTLGGLYTLLPGSTYSGGMPAQNIVISTELRVSFGAVGTKRLEVSFVRMKGRAFSNYEHQPA